MSTSPQEFLETPKDNTTYSCYGLHSPVCGWVEWPVGFCHTPPYGTFGLTASM